MTQLRIDLIDALTGRRLSIVLPDDVPLGQLVPALARKLGLPEAEYVLTVEETGVPLAMEDTLTGASVSEGTTLRLERVVPEVPSIEATRPTPVEIPLAKPVSMPAKPAPTPPVPPAPSAPVHKGGSPGWVWAVAGSAAVLLMVCVATLALGGVALWPRQRRATPTAEIASPSPPLPTATLLPSSTEELIAPTPAGLSNVFVEFILDASGSMMEALEGKTRLRVAKDVLGAHVRALPSETHVGLRVYGHRIFWQDDQDASCQDIELLVSILPGGSVQIAERLETIEARGMTPMSEAIRQAANDFTFGPEYRNSIILVSDGQETCGDDPCDVVRALREVGIDFTIHVIGLEVDEETRTQLQCIAQAAGGRYHDAHSERDLNAALQDVISIATAAGGPPPVVTATALPPTAIPLPPTSTPAPPTPTRVPPTSTPVPTTPAAVPPAIISIDFPDQIPADSSSIEGTVQFRDPDGDINRVTFDVVRATDFMPFAFSPLDFLIEGDATDGTFNFYIRCGIAQEVTLQVTLYDAAGNGSTPVDFGFRCE